MVVITVAMIVPIAMSVVIVVVAVLVLAGFLGADALLMTVILVVDLILTLIFILGGRSKRQRWTRIPAESFCQARSKKQMNGYRRQFDHLPSQPLTCSLRHR